MLQLAKRGRLSEVIRRTLSRDSVGCCGAFRHCVSFTRRCTSSCEIHRRETKTSAWLWVHNVLPTIRRLTASLTIRRRRLSTRPWTAAGLRYMVPTTTPLTLLCNTVLLTIRSCNQLSRRKLSWHIKPMITHIPNTTPSSASLAPSFIRTLWFTLRLDDVSSLVGVQVSLFGARPAYYYYYPTCNLNNDYILPIDNLRNADISDFRNSRNSIIRWIIYACCSTMNLCLMTYNHVVCCHEFRKHWKQCWHFECWLFDGVR